MTDVRYQPAQNGDWVAIASASRLVIVRVSAPGVDIDTLWRLIDSPKGVQLTLDELTRAGISATPSFGLVEWDSAGSARPGAVRSIVRGEVSLSVRTAGEMVIRDPQGVSTWLEDVFSEVEGLEFHTAGAPASSAGSLPLRAGAAWVSRVEVGGGELRPSAAHEPAASFSSSAAPTPVSPPAAASTGVGAAAEPREVAPPVASPAAEPDRFDPKVTVNDFVPPSAEPASTIDESTVNETTVNETTVNETAAAETPGAAADAPPASDAAAASAAAGAYDYLFGETVFRTVEDAAVRDGDEPDEATHAEDSGVEHPDVGDHDGHTVASVDIAKLKAARKSRRASPRAAAGPSLYLELADGRRESLAQPVLVGRAPSANKVSGGQLPTLLTITGTDQDISRNHAQFAVEGGTVVVTDLHSRNGTQITMPGRPPQQLRQGEPTSVIVGTVVDLGGGVTLTVREE